MRKAFASLVLAFSLGTSASAICLLPQPRLVCAEYFHSEAVVTAKFIRAKNVILPDIDGEPDTYLLYTMQTERVLRGKMPSFFKVVDATNASGRALVPEKGQSYLLFVSYMKASKAWAVDNCGNSGQVTASAETLKRIGQLQAGGDGGTIQGNVSSVSGASVLVRGKQGAFKATTDDEGNFEVHVPAGVYSARVMQEGKRFDAEPMSYEDPKRFRVSNGGCAQLQFGLVERN